MYQDKIKCRGVARVGNFRMPLGPLHQQMGNFYCENTDYCCASTITNSGYINPNKPLLTKDISTEYQYIS